MTVATTTTSALAASIRRLAISKDAKRVMLALADAGDWTPMAAMETLLGKSKDATRRMVLAVLALIDERLLDSTGDGKAEPIMLRAMRVEEWEKDDHFTLGANIRWGY